MVSTKNITTGNEKSRSRISPTDDDDDDLRPFSIQAFRTGNADAFTLDPTSAEGLFERSAGRKWLIEGIAALGQPLICGGPAKTLKTSLMVDLALSVANGAPFLGRFPVPRERPVLMLSGESDRNTILETHDRIARAKGLRENAPGCLLFDFRLPQLADRQHLVEVKRVIRHEEIELLILDPTYLCLRGANVKDSTEMGELYKRFADLCLTESCTPVMVHHDRRGTSGKPELANLAHAGIEEFARQWLLLGRRKQYQPGSGFHQLWLTAGGSSGHSAMFAVDVDEGQQQLDFAGRRWNVTVRSESEVEAQVARNDQQRQQRQLGKEDADEAAFLGILDELDQANEGVRAREFRSALRWGSHRVKQTISRLIDQEVIELIERSFTKANGGTQSASWVRRRQNAPS